MSFVCLVTGATGNVGRHVVERLLAAGAEVRATSRQPSTARLPERVEVMRTDGGTFPLDGVSAVFVNATAVGTFGNSTAAEDRLGALLGRAKTHGVRRVVLLSSSSILDDASPVGAHHLGLERQVQDSGLEWTALRPGVFNANTLAWSGGIRAEGVVRAHPSAGHASRPSTNVTSPRSPRGRCSATARTGCWEPRPCSAVPRC